MQDELAALEAAAPAQPAAHPAGDVVRDAERWRYALESDDFAVCKWETIFGEEGWFPISETSEIDAAIDSARKGE